jgi:predicted metal-dependent hydrolase
VKESIHNPYFDCIIIRQDRKKTASVQVSPSNEVSIIVPKDLAIDKIKSLIKRKTPWILSKIKFNQEVKYPHKPKEFVSGEAFQYLGRNYRLKVLSGTKERVELKNGRLNVCISNANGDFSDEKLKRLLTAWYVKNAERKLKERILRYAERLDVTYKDVKVKSFKRQWGSCSTKGELAFNWRIIIAPISIVDYVIVHELCHRLFHDHSKEFWKHLQRIMPDYKVRKEWLRINGALLTL